MILQHRVDKIPRSTSTQFKMATPGRASFHETSYIYSRNDYIMRREKLEQIQECRNTFRTKDINLHWGWESVSARYRSWKFVFTIQCTFCNHYTILQISLFLYFRLIMFSLYLLFTFLSIIL